jgi:multiple sugar transport system substrate-binding protein
MKGYLKIVLIGFVVLSVVLSLGLFGCKTDSGTTTAEETAAEETSAEEAGDLDAQQARAIEDGKKYAGTTIKLICSPDAALQNFKTTVDEFEAATGIIVEDNVVGWDVMFQQTPIALESGEYAYDIVDLWRPWLDQWGGTDALIDLSEYMSVELANVPKEFAASMLSVGGKVPAFLFLPSFEICFYNKDLLTEAGLDPESTPPQTLDEFYNWIVKLSKDTDGDGIVDKPAFLYDFSVDTGWVTYQQFQQAMGQPPFEIIDRKVHMLLNTEGNRETIEYFKRLWDEKLVPPEVLVSAHYDLTSLFNTGDLAMMQQWEMYAGFLDEAMKDNTGYFALPGKTAGTYATVEGHEYLGVTGASQNKEASMALIKYLVSHQNMKARVTNEFMTPLYNQEWEDPALTSERPWLDAVLKAIPYQTPRMFPLKDSNSLITACMAEIHKYLQDQITIDECLENMQSIADTYETLDEAVDNGIYLPYFK